MSEEMISRLKNEVIGGLSQDKAFALQIGAMKNGKLVLRESHGKDYRFFDLASLTKAILTADYFVRMPELRTVKISKILPWLKDSSLRLEDLLNHSSGLKPHVKFFDRFRDVPPDERSNVLKKALREEFKAVKPTSKPLYSDLDFLLLGFAIEELENCSLAQYFERENSIVDLHFNPLPFKGKKTDYAPTEICPWRNKTLRGEVLDGNTFFMGGVAPHAGLFGSLDSVLEYGKKLRSQYKKKPGLFRAKNNEWASGFMVPSGDHSSAGKHFSKKSIGHLGFTGTSFWYDPAEDLFVVILSNRTYPDRNLSGFNKFRPLIQNIIYEETT